MLEILSQYGIEPTQALSAESLVTLRKAYIELCESLDASKESVEAETTSTLKAFKAEVESAENVEAVQQVVSEIRTLVNNLLSETPYLSVLLVDGLQEIKQEMMTERDYQIERRQRNTPSPKKLVGEDFEEKKEQAGQVAEAIRSLFVLLKNDLPKSKKFAEEFPVKESATAGTLPDLPKLPRTPGDSTSPVGRSAKIRQLRFSWNGEDIPAGTFVSDIAHDYVSDRSSGFVVDQRAIRDAVEKSGQEMFSETVWTIEFPTGTLTGWLPAKES